MGEGRSQERACGCTERIDKGQTFPDCDENVKNGQQDSNVGAGKVTAGLAAARQLLSSGHWEAAYYADLSGCISPTSAAFAILSGQLLPYLDAFLAAETVHCPQ